MTPEELRRISNSVGELEGWDFSRQRTERDPVPWDYPEVVHRYLTPDARVLDIGTGGGEVFLSLADSFERGVSLDNDIDRVRLARGRAQQLTAEHVSFTLMDCNTLAFADASFDIILDRHCGSQPSEVVRLLRAGGYFITQQVGSNNTQNFFDVYGWESSSQWWARSAAEHGRTLDPSIDEAADMYRRLGCSVVMRGEYNVRFFFKDVESLVFQLKAPVYPEAFDPDKHWRQVGRLIDEYGTPRGIETNEHRLLLIVRKH